MANEGHVILLKASVVEWNDWRLKNAGLRPDLAGADFGGRNLAAADLSQADLSGADLAGATLRGANLTRAKLFRVDGSESDFSAAVLAKANLSQSELIRADFRGADLEGATLVRANLSGANLGGARLTGANFGQAFLFRANLARAGLDKASLFKADLSEADLSECSLVGANFHAATFDKTNLRMAEIADANLYSALFVRANLEGAVLSNCSVYGASFWNVNLAGARQKGLDIMPVDQPAVSVNDIEVAQLLCQLLHHPRLRSAVEAVSVKCVLLMGRFPAGRRPILDAAEDALRLRGYTSISVDFDAPGSRNLIETIKTLGRMARFIVVDLSENGGIPEMLDAVVHYLPGVPIQPITSLDGEESPAGRHYRKFNWVLPTCRYRDAEDLGRLVASSLVSVAEARRLQL